MSVTAREPEAGLREHPARRNGSSCETDNDHFRREFTKLGYKVGLIAKSEDNLRNLADELKSLGGEVSPRSPVAEHARN